MIGQHRNLTFEQRGIDALSASGPVTRFEREQDTYRAEHARAEIRYRDAGSYRPASFLTGNAHAAREGLHEHVVRPVLGSRSVRSKATDSAVDETWVDGGERLITEAEFFERPDAEIVDEHV